MIKVPMLRSFLKVFSLAVLGLLLVSAGMAQTATVTSVLTVPGGATFAGGEAIYTDVYGNIFAVNSARTAVYEVPANGGPVVTIDTGLTTVLGVAADASGNVFICTNTGTTILKVVAPYGSSNATTFSGNGTALSKGYHLATDSTGDVYVADGNASKIYKYTPAGIQSVVASVAGTKGVASDPSGNIYATNGTSSVVQEILYNSGTQTYGTAVTISTPGVTLNTPYGLALDHANNLYIMEGAATGGRVIQVISPLSSPTANVLASGITSGVGIAVTSQGDVVYGAYSKMSFLPVANSGGNFYGQNVATASTTTSQASIGITFPTQITTPPAAVTYLSNNASTSSFTAGVTTNTCTNSHTFAASSTCVIYVGINPVAAGPISGGINLWGCAGSGTCAQGSAVVLATVNFTGTGDAPVAAFGPGTQSTYITGLTQPQGVAVDAGGNAYTVDASGAKVYKTTSSGTTTNLGFTGLSRPIGVAVDGAGSVYVVDTYNYAVYKQTSGGVQSTVTTSGLLSPKGIAVDGFSNLYIADAGNHRVVKVSATGVQSVVGFSGLSSPTWVAVDTAGNLFVTDTGSVYEYTVGGVQSTVTTSGIGTPAGISVSTNGSLFLADSSNNNIYVLPAGGSAFTLATGLSSPAGIAVAANGSLYVANSGSTTASKIDRTADILSFPNTRVGVASSPLTAIVQNVGNATLTYSNFAVANTSGAGYAQKTPVNGTTDCNLSATVAPGASCNVSVVFTPTSAATITGTATSTDNALNVSGAQQAVSLTGVGINNISTTTTVAQTVPSSGNPTYGQTFTVTASVTPSAATGTVTFYVDSVAGSPVTLVSGSASTSPAGLTAGSHSIYAVYSGDSNYATSTSSTLPITMNKATPVVSWTPSVTQELVDSAVGSGVLDATVTSPAGSIAYTATPAGGSAVTINSSSVLGAATYTLTATFTPTDTTDYNLAYGTVSSFLVGCHDGTATGVTACNPSFTDNFNKGYVDPTIWSNSYTDFSTWKADRPTWMPDTFDMLPGSGVSIRADARSTYFPNGGVTGNTQCDSSSTSYKCYTTGAMTTHYSFAQTYGYYEISTQLYPGPGMFPAFWMLPEDTGATTTNQNTQATGISEIDIFEGDTTYMDNAWFGLSGTNTHVLLGSTIYDKQVSGAWPSFNPTSGYHTYGLAWTPTTLTFYVDGSQISTYNVSAQLAFPMYLLVDADLGGPGGAPSGSSGFPQFMNIAYVHAYQYYPASSSGTINPISWAVPSINDTTTNPSQPTVYTHTVNVGDVLNISSTLYNNTTVDTLTGTVAGDGPHTTMSVTDYFDVAQTANIPAPINMPTPIGPSSSESFTFSYTVPALSPGVYNLDVAATWNTNPFNWSSFYAAGAANRFTVVTQPRLSLSSLAFVSGEPQTGTKTLGNSNYSIDMAGNMWLAETISSYTTTYYTMLEFDFNGNDTADEYAIGFFPSSTYSQTGLIQVGGGSALASIQNYNHYKNANGTVHYMIPIGKNITPGTVLTNLVLLSTSAGGTANGTFNNIRLYDMPMSTSNPLSINSIVMP